MAVKLKLTRPAPAYPAQNGAALLSMIRLSSDIMDDDQAGPTAGMLLDSDTILYDDGTYTDVEADGSFAEWGGRWRAVRGVPGDAINRYWVPEKFVEVQVELPEETITGTIPDKKGAGAGLLLAALLTVGAILWG